MIETVNFGGFDLVVAGQYQDVNGRHRMLIDADKISIRTDVPVISLPVGRRLTRVYSMLIPVTYFLPLRKLMYAAFIASNDRASLKLLGVTTEKSAGRTEYLLKKSYELIHSSASLFVGLALTHSGNVAAAVNELSNKECTDLVIVSPVEQTRLPGQALSFMGKSLQKYASSPIITVNPL